MIMTKILEKMSLLGLSLLLISAFSISTALPPMLDYYSPTYNASQVELLVSVPSFSVVAMLLLNPFVDKWLNDRQLIMTGLILLSSAGIFPFFVQWYPLVLLSRLVFGMGIGFINAKAISIISQRYQGKERIQMLGIRGSVELIGGASCSLLVGQLLKIHWTLAFLIYGFGFIILAMYLLFVPPMEQIEKKEIQKSKQGLNKKDFAMILGMALLSGFVICINSSISLRVPLFQVDGKTIVGGESALVLSLEQGIGIAAGLSFASLLAHIKNRLLPMALLCLSICLFGIALANNLLTLILFSVGVGFFYSIILTFIFHRLSECIARNLLNKATAYVLLGCNLGSAVSPYVLKLLALVSSSFSWIFLAYAIVSFLLFLGFLLNSRMVKKA
ncbi:MFS transporter [Streptococcus thermophilus]|uniref:Major facilitator superfamily transporter n=1 Tax=Streptococcus thermophilus TaxID=1308 RepID=A0A2X3U5M0_STRTR|nr:MFS transporter [Streptococcus thermophilus]MBW7797202.1 MFS transporter [Streptococcus thermophilus]MBW7821779.1 MFS transporter [Streptococcus thermophilus]MDA3674157.1 MFS transporter [Streptococcus thermophilus]MDA5413352.1 MFS transporter [Streptococcus thermophilus]PJH76942.1 MFS transporter [Streptococcus thermophilus]